MDIEIWKSQLRKGAAELAILSLLDLEPLSGLGIVDNLATRPNIGLSGGSVYPLLNRLERDGRIIGAWKKPGLSGRSLKVYRLTKDGRKVLVKMQQEWHSFSAQLSFLVGESQ